MARYGEGEEAGPTGLPRSTYVGRDEVNCTASYRIGMPRAEDVGRRCGGHLQQCFRGGSTPDWRHFCINACDPAPRVEAAS
jgi:peptide methionine sulfoxide reductase MsrB